MCPRGPWQQTCEVTGHVATGGPRALLCELYRALRGKWLGGPTPTQAHEHSRAPHTTQHIGYHMYDKATLALAWRTYVRHASLARACAAHLLARTYYSQTFSSRFGCKSRRFDR